MRTTEDHLLEGIWVYGCKYPQASEVVATAAPPADSFATGTIVISGMSGRQGGNFHRFEKRPSIGASID